MTWLKISLMLKGRDHALGMPGEKRDIGAHVVASYFIPGTGFPVLEANESAQVSCFAVFVGKPGS